MDKQKKHKAKAQLSAVALSDFFEQLYMYLQSGIPTWEALSIISENTSNKEIKALYNLLYNKVADGELLSVAMSESNVFPVYAIGMTAVGEQTGRIEETTLALKKYYLQKDELKKSIRSAVAYPLCMAGMVLVVILVLIMRVMPVFEQVFAQLGLSLNSFAQSLLSMGEFINNSSLIILLGIAVLVALFFIIKATQKGKKLLSHIYITFPLTKKLAQAQNANTFAFSMSLMLASGIETLTAFDFAQDLAESEEAKGKINIIRTALESGKSLNTALIEGDIFKEDYQGMVVAGMRTGAVSEMLMNIAERYDKEANERVQKLLSILEPTLVAVLCVMVGLVMLSVMLPLTGILAGL